MVKGKGSGKKTSVWMGFRSFVNNGMANYLTVSTDEFYIEDFDQPSTVCFFVTQKLELVVWFDGFGFLASSYERD